MCILTKLSSKQFLTLTIMSCHIIILYKLCSRKDKVNIEILLKWALYGYLIQHSGNQIQKSLHCGFTSTFNKISLYKSPQILFQLKFRWRTKHLTGLASSPHSLHSYPLIPGFCKIHFESHYNGTTLLLNKKILWFLHNL